MKTSPRRRRFYVEFSAHIDIDQRLLDAVLTNEWRGIYYDLMNEHEVAEHLAWNLAKGRELSSLDGFADRKPVDAALLDFVTEGSDEVKVVSQRRGRKKKGLPR